MPKEEVDKGLLKLDLLDKGIVLALCFQIHSYTSLPNIWEEAHKLVDVAYANIHVSMR